MPLFSPPEPLFSISTVMLFAPVRSGTFWNSMLAPLSLNALNVTPMRRSTFSEFALAVSALNLAFCVEVGQTLVAVAASL